MRNPSVSTLANLITQNPEYRFATQFAPANGRLNSVIGFFNYYDQVFRDAAISVTLHMVFYDAAGNECSAHSVKVGPNDAVQFDARANGVDSDGMVAVAAIPDLDIQKINNSKLKLRSSITTGFYIKWENEQGGRDIMHEWAALRSKPLGEATHHIGFVRVATPIEHGVVLMNPVSMAGAASLPRLRLRESGSRRTLAESNVEPIPAMGSRTIKLTDHFPDFSQRLEAGAVLVVDVMAENLSPPLTMEWHPCGDFHIHHL
jgi:hypothetical protein